MHSDLSLPILIILIDFPRITESCKLDIFFYMFQNGVIFQEEGLLVIHDKLHL